MGHSKYPWAEFQLSSTHYQRAVPASLLRMTHPCSFNVPSDFLEKFGVGLRILSTDQHMERNLTALQLIQMLSYIRSVYPHSLRCLPTYVAPFFAVVTMYMPSRVKRKRVAGNS